MNTNTNQANTTQVNDATTEENSFVTLRSEITDELQCFKLGAIIGFSYAVSSLGVAALLGVNAGTKHNLIGIAGATIVGGLATKYIPDLRTGLTIAFGSGVLGSHAIARTSEKFLEGIINPQVGEEVETSFE